MDYQIFLVWGSALVRVELRYITRFLPSWLIHTIKYLKPFSGKKPNERAKVMFSYGPEYPDDLELCEGDIITILNKDGDWWEGEVNGKVGLFPSNFVELLPAEEEDTSVEDKVIILMLYIPFWARMNLLASLN